ncbi:MAG: HK97 gp10 family phage protein [Clostridia bacterium]|nr:HK97 gp10 family phage protein [Clostridia bacterium]
MAKYDELINIRDILNEYSSDIQEGITEAAYKVAENGKNKLRVTSPKKTGDYRKGWRVGKKSGKGFVHATIYNATDWQLTHLLEKPHALRNGKRSTPKVHIEPVEQECIAQYQKDVEQIIKNGG